MTISTRDGRAVNGALPMRRGWAVLLGVVLVGMLAACGGAPGGGGAGEGPGHRSQRLALTADQELALGRQAYQEVLSHSQVLPHDSSEAERVRRVGERIVQASQIEPLQREINLHIREYKFEWAFNVLRDRQINAFCLPGGKVAVFTRLLPVVENDDQLATVMGHEIAHALAHHASERIARQQMVETAERAVNGTLGELSPGKRRALIGVLAAGAQVGSLGYNRAQESEADHIGIFLMTFAGYDPEQAVVFWKRMEQATAGRGRPPEILSDHPSDAHRIAQLEEWVPRVKGAKKAYDSGNIAPPKRR